MLVLLLGCPFLLRNTYLLSLNTHLLFGHFKFIICDCWLICLTDTWLRLKASRVHLLERRLLTILRFVFCLDLFVNLFFGERWRFLRRLFDVIGVAGQTFGVGLLEEVCLLSDLSFIGFLGLFQVLLGRFDWQVIHASYYTD